MTAHDNIAPLALLDEFDGKKLVFCRDAESGLRAIIAVHSTALGPAAGGLRMKCYESEGEAARDALRLARAMTLKYAAAEMAVGGAKAVIIGDPACDKTADLLWSFGRYVEEQHGEYSVGADVGTNNEDMKLVAQETQWMVSLPRDAGGPGDVSATTAAGVLHAIRACCQHRWGEPSVRGRSVAVQGLGQVGMKLARDLVGKGARVVVADLDTDRVAAAVSELGVAAVPPDAIDRLDVEIFAPCALGDVITERNVDQIRASVVAGAANNVFSSTDVADRLEARGRIYAVDFVANAGGIVYDEQMLQRPRPASFDEASARASIDGIFNRTLRVFEIAAEQHVPLWRAALAMAEANLVSARGQSPVNPTKREEAMPYG